jgi:hypothetical protein
MHNHTNDHWSSGASIAPPPFDSYVVHPLQIYPVHSDSLDSSITTMTNSSLSSGQYMYTDGGVSSTSDWSINEQQTQNGFNNIRDHSIPGSMQNTQTFVPETAGTHNQHALQSYYNFNATGEPHSFANINESPFPMDLGLIEDTIMPNNSPGPIGMIHFPP